MLIVPLELILWDSDIDVGTRTFAVVGCWWAGLGSDFMNSNVHNDTALWPMQCLLGIVCMVYRQSLFTGLDHWTGLLDWNTGLAFDPKNGIQKASFSPL